MDDDLRVFLADSGYIELRTLPTGQIAGLLRYAFTWAVVVGLDRYGYERRYCYEYPADALRDLREWDGTGHPSGPWVKCKGGGIDLFNPALEAI